MPFSESICMTAWTDNIMHIAHLEVLLHVEKEDKSVDNYKCYEEEII